MNLKTVFTNAEISEVKIEIDKALIEIQATNFEELEDEVALKTLITGMQAPYIISSKEDQINLTISMLDNTVEQLKAIRNIDGLSEFTTSRCQIIKDKVRTLQLFYADKDYAKIDHRFKPYNYYTKKGDVIVMQLEAATKQQQTKTRITAQVKILKMLTIIDTVLQEEEAKRLRGGAEIPERMTYKTKSRDQRN